MSQRRPFAPRWLATSPGVSIDYLDEGATEIDPFPSGAVIDRVVARVESIAQRAHAHVPLPVARHVSPVPLLLVAIAAVIGVSIGFVMLRGGASSEAIATILPAAPHMVPTKSDTPNYAMFDRVPAARTQKRDVTAGVPMRLAEEAPPATKQSTKRIAKRVAKTKRVATADVKPAKRRAVAPTGKRRVVRVDASTPLGTLRVK
jgi:hypothetical protein